MSPRPSAHAYKYVAIGLVACSMLIHEILLTRICALRLHFHFAFLIISNCLLGLGASGTLLSRKQAAFRLAPRVWLGRFTLAYTGSLVATYLLLRKVPLPSELSLAEPAHLVALCGFNLAGAVPFFFGGVVIGMLLTFDVERVDRLYAVDLIGAGLGCIACPSLLPLLGAGGVFLVSVLLAVIASVVVVHDRFGARALGAGAIALIAILALLPSFDRLLPIPSKGTIDWVRQVESAFKLGAPYSVWTANSRIDLVRVPKGTPAFIFMRGSAQAKLHDSPEWAGISQDATAGTIIVNYSEEPAALEILRRSMYSTAYRLKQRPSVLVIGLGGGNDVWAAKVNGARSIKAIELNWPIVDIHQKVLRRYSRGLVTDPSTRLVVGEGRSALMRETQRYDVIQMSGIDTWTALASGAYVLAENYLYTREAIASMYERLEPGGVLQIARFAATMEALRLVSNIHAALESLEVRGLEHSVMALATADKMLAVLVKKGAFNAAEQESTLAFASTHGIEVVYMPKRPGKGLLEEFLRSKDRRRIIEGFPTNLEPTDDDRPYFFNYAKWQHPIESIKHLGDVPAVSQGNPFFILVQLLLSIVLSAALILLPVGRIAGGPRHGLVRYLVYFAGLGAGFILVELAVLQKLTLFLGQPLYSLTVTLFSLLVFTGLGSLLFARRFALGDRRVLVVPVLLTLYLAAMVVGSPLLVSELIGLELWLRIGLTVLLLAPLGLLLGVPFAYGLRVLDAEDPSLAPWAWAINGCLSVVGSILTVIVSMNFGFAAVLWAAAAIYLVAFAALLGGRSTAQAPR